MHMQAEHKLVESAWPTSMRNLLGPNSILTAGRMQHKQQRQILSQVCDSPSFSLSGSREHQGKTWSSALPPMIAGDAEPAPAAQAFTKAAMQKHLPFIMNTRSA